MCFSREGFCATYAFHSSSSILPSPFASASLKVCKQSSNLIQTKVLGTNSGRAVGSSSLPCRQSFWLHHRAKLDQIHTEEPTPSLSAAIMEQQTFCYICFNHLNVLLILERFILVSRARFTKIFVIDFTNLFTLDKSSVPKIVQLKCIWEIEYQISISF